MERPPNSHPLNHHDAEWNRQLHNQRLNHNMYKEVRVVPLQESLNGRQQHQAMRQPPVESPDERDVEISRLREEVNSLKIELEKTVKERDHLMELTSKRESTLTRYAREINSSASKPEEKVPVTEVASEVDSKMPLRKLNEPASSHSDNLYSKQPSALPPPREAKPKDPVDRRGQWESARYNSADYDYRYHGVRHPQHDQYFERAQPDYNPSYGHSQHPEYRSYEQSGMYPPPGSHGYHVDPYYSSREYDRYPTSYDPRNGSYGYEGYRHNRWNDNDIWANSRRDPHGHYELDRSTPNPNQRSISVAARYKEGRGSARLHEEEVRYAKIAPPGHKVAPSPVHPGSAPVPQKGWEDRSSRPVREDGVHHFSTDPRGQTDTVKQQRCMELLREDGRHHPASPTHYLPNDSRCQTRPSQQKQQSVGSGKQLNKSDNDPVSEAPSQGSRERFNPPSEDVARNLSREGRPLQAAQVDNPFARQDRQNSNIMAQTSIRPENGAKREPGNLYGKNCVQPNINKGVPPNNPYIKKDGYPSASKLIQPNPSISKRSNSFDQNDAYPSRQGVLKKRVINASFKTSSSSNRAYGTHRSPNQQGGFQAECVNGAVNRERSCPGTGHNPLKRASKPVSGPPTSARSCPLSHLPEKAVQEQRMKGLVMGPHDPTKETVPMVMKSPSKSRKRRGSGRGKGGRRGGRGGDRRRGGRY